MSAVRMPDPDVVASGEAALQLLDSLQPDGSAQTRRRLDEVLRHLLAMRDGIVAAGRAGRPCDEWLYRANAIVSSIFGTEFPQGGLQWKRVCESREALRKLLTERAASAT